MVAVGIRGPAHQLGLGLESQPARRPTRSPGRATPAPFGQDEARPVDAERPAGLRRVFAPIDRPAFVPSSAFIVANPLTTAGVNALSAAPQRARSSKTEPNQ